MNCATCSVLLFLFLAIQFFRHWREFSHYNQGSNALNMTEHGKCRQFLTLLKNWKRSTNLKVSCLVIGRHTALNVFALNFITNDVDELFITAIISICYTQSRAKTQTKLQLLITFLQWTWARCFFFSPGIVLLKMMDIILLKPCLWWNFYARQHSSSRLFAFLRMISE